MTARVQRCLRSAAVGAAAAAAEAGMEEGGGDSAIGGREERRGEALRCEARGVGACGEDDGTGENSCDKMPPPCEAGDCELAAGERIGC